MRALVLGGGNVDGIFAGAGAAKALGAASGEFAHLSGASAGALVATAVAAGRLHRIEELIETLRPADLVAPDRPLADLRRARRLLARGHLLDASGLWRLLVEEFPDPVLAAIPPGLLVVTTYDLRRRRSIEWSPSVGPRVFRQALFASMSVPFATSSVRLEHEGRRYELVDGGVTATHPVAPVLPQLWKARQEDGEAELVVVSTLSFKPEEEIPGRGLKRLYRILKSVKAGFVIEQSNADFDRAAEIGVRQRWIQVVTPNLDLEGFTREELRRAHADGFETASRAGAAALTAPPRFLAREEPAPGRGPA